MGDNPRNKELKRAADMISKEVNLTNLAETISERSSFDNKMKMKMHLAHGVILTAVFALSMYKATKDRVTTLLIAISVFIVILFICDLMLRLCQVLISLADTNSSEDFSLLNRYLIPNTASVVVVACAALSLLGQIVVSRRCPLCYVWNCEPHVCTLSMIFSFLLLRSVAFELETSGSAVFNLNDLKGLDYGTGMAYSYYYGYLRLILPSTGTYSKSIVEKIENFEDKHGITFPVHKLFILIPSSGYIPPDLKEASDQWMESAQELEEEKRNRAGVVGRTYRNNAYKIYPGGRKSGANPVYVVVEGATPLLTFYEVQKHNHAEALLYRQFKHEIITTFHMKLHSALQNELDTKDLCELIYYDDYKDGTKVNIAKIILKRISELRCST
ncbi:stimulator of interferon genes protein [Odontomachus brunneus]|uniref:stimulator of interferon genes protein n=1 Tax=Odontomachus brunneus TaxID=486640 RepID=UPI0013F24231|nr:stimulator of interferon genes protein [Odontomachus brunneus]